MELLGLRPVAHTRKADGTMIRAQDIQDLLASGMTHSEVARHFGISDSGVRYHCRRLGLPPKSLKAEAAPRRAEVWRLYRAGMRRIEIARQMALPYKLVCRYLTEPAPTLEHTDGATTTPAASAAD